jgi:hypothetical protein
MKNGVLKEITQEFSMLIQKGASSHTQIKEVEISKMKQEVQNIINSMSFIQLKNNNLEARILELGQRI